MATPWSEPVVKGQPAKAIHVIELRSAIDANIAGADPPISPWPWTWLNLNHPQAPHPAPILARYFTEMQAAIQRLWDNKGRGALPRWSSNVTPGGPSNNRAPTHIRATDITDLRRWLNQYEDNHPRYGVDSKSYDPSANNRPLIEDSSPNDWAQDVKDLAPRPLVVRCEIVARETGSGRISLSDDDLDWYREAFARYRAKLHVPIPMLTLRTIAPVGWTDPSSEWYLHTPLNASFSNQFIDFYSDEAKRIMQRLSFGPLSARHVIIWNEPNGAQGGFISFEHFAAILYHCRQKLNQVNPRPQMYWVGVLFAGEPGHPDTVDTVPKMVVEGIYQKLVDESKAGPTGPWPWNGVNVHIHRERTPTYVERFFEFLDGEVRDRRQDNGLIVIGEWGITV